MDKLARLYVQNIVQLHGVSFRTRIRDLLQGSSKVYTGRWGQT
jgi:hypothetical protein